MGAVEERTYRAVVPTAEQSTLDWARDISEGFEELRAAGVDRITLRVDEREATFDIDGAAIAARAVEDRVQVRDLEGPGLFKGRGRCWCWARSPWNWPAS